MVQKAKSPTNTNTSTSTNKDKRSGYRQEKIEKRKYNREYYYKRDPAKLKQYREAYVKRQKKKSENTRRYIALKNNPIRYQKYLAYQNRYVTNRWREKKFKEFLDKFKDISSEFSKPSSLPLEIKPKPKIHKNKNWKEARLKRLLSS